VDVEINPPITAPLSTLRYGLSYGNCSSRIHVPRRGTFNAVPSAIAELRVVGSRYGPIDELLSMCLVAQGCQHCVDCVASLLHTVTNTCPLPQDTETIQCVAKNPP